MNLHRVGDRPDYYDDSTTLSSIQELALVSHGIITPANAVTLGGLALTINGLRDLDRGDRSFKPIMKVLAGRALDVADGFVADYFKTKSSVGEAADSLADKLAAFYAFKVLYNKSQEKVMPMPFLQYVVAQNSLNSIFTVAAKLSGKNVHSSFSGKIATTAQWTAIGSYLIAETCKYHQYHLGENLFKGIGHTAAVLNVGLGSKATFELARSSLGR